MRSVAEAASVREAIEKLKEYPCDVMFLDINMPEATGLQLADALRHLKFPPAVVFVTAYSEHALDAFKVSAVDYLLKPVETDRLAQTIARVREQVALHVQAQKSERIPVEKGGKKILISIDKIRFVMARDDYAYLQTDTDRSFLHGQPGAAGEAAGRPRVLPRAPRLSGEPLHGGGNRVGSGRHVAAVAFWRGGGRFRFPAVACQR